MVSHVSMLHGLVIEQVVKLLHFIGRGSILIGRAGTSNPNVNVVLQSILALLFVGGQQNVRIIFEEPKMEMIW